MRHPPATLLNALCCILIALACGDEAGEAPDSGLDSGSDLDIDSDSDTDTDTQTDTGTCENLVWEGDYGIDAGADIDPLVSYAVVTGDLLITADAITDISELQCLSEIGGHLRIFEAASLIDLGGLQALDTIGGDFEIIDVEDGGVGSITNATLPSLDDLGGSLVLSDNPDLTNLSVSNLTAIGGDLALSRNPLLTTITAFDLVVVNGDFAMVDNANLEDFTGLYSLGTVNGDLIVTGNGILPYCEVCDLLDQLSGFGGAVTCHDNAADSCWTEDALDCP